MNGGRQRVAVIGGGFAGLAAGVTLADAGCDVTLLESRPQLGGRAYSFRDQATGMTVDNGQHAMMGCYTHTLAFLERIGAASRLFRQDNLRVTLVDPLRGTGTIDCPPMPGPLHATAGVLRYRLLRPAERLRALIGGVALLAMRRRRDPRLAQATVDQLLTTLGQSANARQSFWNPIAVATCNESPERAAAAPFAEVMALAFFGSRADSQFVFSRVGLSELYTDLARQAIEARGGRVELHAAVERIETRDARIAALALRDGRRLEVDACVSAVPPASLLGFAGPLAAELGLDALAAIESSPIVSVHLWFDRSLLDEPFVGLVGRATHWLFDRGRIAGQPHCMSAVISAGRELVEHDSAEITRAVVDDLQACVPGAREARLEHAVVVKEKRATMSTTPASERLRPRATTRIANLFLAGDWTATGLPPTIESAVRSAGQAAALAAAWVRGH